MRALLSIFCNMQRTGSAGVDPVLSTDCETQPSKGCLLKLHSCYRPLQPTSFMR